jgi:hypothetical protein
MGEATKGKSMKTPNLDQVAMITREFLRQQGACYNDDKIATLVPPDGIPLLGVLVLAIPADDRIWAATLPGVCPPSVLWEWQALLTERALGRTTDPDARSLAVIPLLRRLAAGEDVPQNELAAASAAARAAYWDAAWAAASAATAAAWAAASAAARAAATAAASAAARAAATAAARAAARAAEQDQQIADLKHLLNERVAVDEGKP